jgi:hypothetical protein
MRRTVVLTPRVRRWLRLSLLIGFVGLHGSWAPAVAQPKGQGHYFPRLYVGNAKDEEKYALYVRANGPGQYGMRVESYEGHAVEVLPNGDLRVGRDLAVGGSVYGNPKFKGSVTVEQDLVVYGAKKFARPHPTDPQKMISYAALEGPEAGTYVRGTARLIGGEAIVELPEHFRLVSAEDRLTVALTPLGQWLQLYVAEKSVTRIVVREVGRRSGQFDYLVQGIRRGFEDYKAVVGTP